MRVLFCENSTGIQCHRGTESAQNQNPKPGQRKQWLPQTVLKRPGTQSTSMNKLPMMLHLILL